LFILLSVSVLSLSSASGSEPTNHCWLLSSPMRQYLSSGGEFALQVFCSERDIAENQSENTVALLTKEAAPQTDTPLSNVRVNDPSTDIPENTTQSETTIAIFGNTVLVGYVDTAQFNPRTNGVSTLSGYARSLDGGHTFTDMGRGPSNEQGWGFSDPDIGVDSQGNFYFANIQFTPSARGQNSFMGIAKSIDGGLTFGRPILIKGTGPEDVHFQDKELIALDNTNSPFDGNVYMSWTEFSPQGSQILFVRSMDGGITYSEPLVLSKATLGFVQGSMPAVGPNGEVYVVWLAAETSSERALRIRRSDDGGVTFGPEVTIASLRPTADPTASRRCGRQALKGNIRTLELPAIAVDRSDGPTKGSVYVVYQSDPDGDGPDTSDVFFTRSTDGGLRWSAPIRVNDDQTTTDQWMPSVAVTYEGTIGVMFYDRRRDPENNLKIDVYMAVSRDGGQSFSPNFRITDVPFDVPPTAPNFDSLRGICYMGDYNHITADDQFFYLAWGDNRSVLKTERFPEGRPDPDVFFAKVFMPRFERE